MIEDLFNQNRTGTSALKMTRTFTRSRSPRKVVQEYQPIGPSTA